MNQMGKVFDSIMHEESKTYPIDLLIRKHYVKIRQSIQGYGNATERKSLHRRVRVRFTLPRFANSDRWFYEKGHSNNFEVPPYSVFG